MAHHKATKKSILQVVKRTARNRVTVGEARTAVKKVEAALESKDTKAAAEALKLAQSRYGRAVKKNALKKNTAARKISRLSARVKALTTAK